MPCFLVNHPISVWANLKLIATAAMPVRMQIAVTIRVKSKLVCKFLSEFGLLVNLNTAA